MLIFCAKTASLSYVRCSLLAYALRAGLLTDDVNQLFQFFRTSDFELTPVFSLNYAKKFQKNYRNVLVLPKLTFPDEKVLRLEISENQISGRVIVLTIEYEDILNADGFDSDILKNSDYYPYYYIKYSVEQ